MRHVYFFCISLTFACSSTPEQVETPYNLPGIWSTAILIENFTQEECNEDMEAVMESAPKASVKAVNDSLIITYPNAHFRCDQAVQGFIKQTEKGYSILIQPKELNPAMVAKCDCGYKLVATLPKTKSNDVRVFHRGDNFVSESTIRESQVISE